MNKMRADMAKIKIKMQKSRSLNDSDELEFELHDLSDKDKARP